MTWQPLWSDPSGTQTYMRENADGTFTIWSTKDNDPLLDLNKAMANENNGYSPSKDIRRIASVPLHFIQEYKDKTGVDLLNPHHDDARKRLFNDGSFAHLRTAHWRV
ncbi:MAG: hypothetical protein A3E78_09490 [Alphaproteobacteria bacterium RIFCSPHIGHO2_12_FULL_63_12]|nr:MAG: hypothetical protein A3E78_09490 [Alphaproteobacteria bacterium RIFCSPHIGHO2_12_FULL_63_12]